MKIIKPDYKIEKIDGIEMLKRIEEAGKTCYKSEHTINYEKESYKDFVKMVIQRGHESVLEHEKITVRVICDRGVTHEIVRHRIASYSQESTRYCNYSNNKFGNEITVIDIHPHVKAIKDQATWIHEVLLLWKKSIETSEESYKKMIKLGVTPQIARSVLPQSLKTEIVITMNLREWRYFFRLRALNTRAHPQLREITVPMLEDFKKLVPIVFDDLKNE